MDGKFSGAIHGGNGNGDGFVSTHLSSSSSAHHHHPPAASLTIQSIQFKHFHAPTHALFSLHGPIIFKMDHVRLLHLSASNIFHLSQISTLLTLTHISLGKITTSNGIFLLEDVKGFHLIDFEVMIAEASRECTVLNLRRHISQVVAQNGSITIARDRRREGVADILIGPRKVRDVVVEDVEIEDCPEREEGRSCGIHSMAS